MKWRSPARALLLALAAAPAAAQNPDQPLVVAYDLTSTSYIFCRSRGGGSGPVPQPVFIKALVKTTGSSTTFNAVTGGTNPFAGLVAGDALVFPSVGGLGLAGNIVAIRTWNSADQVVVDTAYDLGANGINLSYLKLQCGTADTDGWVRTSRLEDAAFNFQLKAIAATNIQMIVQCRAASPGALPIQVYPDNSGGAASRTYTAAGADSRTTVVLPKEGNYSECRMGYKVTGDAGTQSLDVLMSGTNKAGP